MWSLKKLISQKSKVGWWLPEAGERREEVDGEGLIKRYQVEVRLEKEVPVFYCMAE